MCTFTDWQFAVPFESWSFAWNDNFTALSSAGNIDTYVCTMYVLETFQNKIKSEDENYYFHRTSYSRKLVARGVVFFSKTERENRSS